MNPDYTAPAPTAVLIPPVSITRTAPPSGLPETGSNTGPILAVAIMLVIVGAVAVWMAWKVRKAATK